MEVSVGLDGGPELGLLLNAARIAAQGRNELVLLRVAVPLTEVPAKLTSLYSARPVEFACKAVNPEPGRSEAEWCPVATKTKSLAAPVGTEPVAMERPVPFATVVTSRGLLVAAPEISYTYIFRKLEVPIVAVMRS